MDTRKTPEVWHRLSNESGRAYEAFKVYMYMSPSERSVVGAWREWTGNPEAARPSPFFEGWAREHAWNERARAFDHHIEHIRRPGMEKGIEEESEWQARQVERVRGRFHELMAITYERAITNLEDDSFVEQMRPADVVQILRVHLETVHKLGDTEPEAGGAATVDWSEDEQRELEQIMGEIESEEAQGEGSEDGEEGSEDAEGEQD